MMDAEVKAALLKLMAKIELLIDRALEQIAKEPQ